MSKCGLCDSVMINGVYCHEADCPESWRDCVRTCRYCGDKFRPASRIQEACESCNGETECECCGEVFDASMYDSEICQHCNGDSELFDEHANGVWDYEDDLESLQFHNPIYESDLWNEY